MNYTEKARGVALDYYKKLDALNAQIKGIEEKYKAERITRKVKEEQVSAVNAKIKELSDNMLADLNRLQSEHDAAVDTWAAPAGDKVHSDIKLLEGAFALTEDELTGLSKKHRENATMQRAIRSYANKNQIHYDSSTPLPEQKKEAFASLCVAIRRSTKDEYRFHRAFIEDDKQFANVIGIRSADHGEFVPPKKAEEKEVQNSLADKIDAVFARHGGIAPQD